VHFTVPCETPNIIESKSFKLYLNSFNSTVFADLEVVRERLRVDLGEALWRGSDRAAGIGGANELDSASPAQPTKPTPIGRTLAVTAALAVVSSRPAVRQRRGLPPHPTSATDRQ